MPAGSVGGRSLLVRDGHLVLGEPDEQTVTVSVPNGALHNSIDLHVTVGDTVAMHWDWVCDVLRDDQVEALRAHTLDQLQRTNTMLVGSVA